MTNEPKLQPATEEGNGPIHRAWLSVTLWVALVGAALINLSGRAFPMVGDNLTYARAGEYILSGQYPHIAAPPLLPVLMQLGARVLPWWEPWEVGRALAVLCYALAIPPLYLIARQVSSRGAPLAVALYFLTADMIYAGTTPLTEAPFLCTILWAIRFWLTGRSLWAVAALTMVGGLVRTEALLVPAAMAAVELSRRRLPAALALLASAAPAAAWTVWGTLLGRTGPYQGEVAVAGHAGITWLQALVVGVLRMMPGGLVPEVKAHAGLALAAYGLAALALLIAILLGFRVVARREPVLFRFALVFLVLHTAVHMWFAAAGARYTVGITWILFTAVAAVVAWALAPEGETSTSRLWAGRAVAGFAVFHIVVGMLWRGNIQPLIALVPVALAYGLAAWTLIREPDTGGRAPARPRLAWVAVLLAGTLSWGTASHTSYVRAWFWNRFAELVPAATALERLELGPGRRVLCAGSTSGFLRAAKVPRSVICEEWELTELSEEALDRHGVAYVLWTSTTFGPLARSYDEYRYRTLQQHYPPGMEPLSVVRAVAEGRFASWREVERYEVDRFHWAVLYGRASKEP